MSRRLTALGATLILAAGLAGCGKVGQLEPAAPMFGHKAAAEAPTPQDPTRSVQTVDPRDRASDGQVPPPPEAPGAPTPR